MADSRRDDVRIRPWADGDFTLLERLLRDPRMTSYLGGPETPEKLRDRHERYLAVADASEGVYAIVVGSDAAATAVGWVGLWDSEWLGQPVLEIGWSVLPEFQGCGVATAAAAQAIERARESGRHRAMHAFPSIDNAASNAVCRKLGFELLGAVDIEYPPGRPMRSNHWRLDPDA